MAYLLGTICAVATCLLFGGFSIAFSTAAILIAATIFFKKDYLINFSIGTFISSTLVTAYLSSWTTGIILSSSATILVRYGRNPISPKLWIAFIPAAACFAYGLREENQIIQIIALQAALLSIPLPRNEFRTTRTEPKFLKFIWLAFLTVFLGIRTSEKTAILDHGDWAKTTPGFSLSDLNISSSYSYSELLKLIGGTSISVKDISGDLSTVWLLTPTKPFSEEEIQRIYLWIKEGGHLIISADHTDLYGHGRVLNSLLKGTKTRISLATTLPNATDDLTNYSQGGIVHLLSSCTISGPGVYPILSEATYREKAYYNSPNFFGPFSISGDDRFSRWLVGTTQSLGEGFVTIIADSTVFANFALFRPGNPELITELQSVRPIARLFPLFPYFCLIIGLLSILYSNHFPSLILLGIIPLVSIEGPPLQWTSNDFFWSGDKDLVLFSSPSSESFSTAYCISALSGARPRWTDHPTRESSGVWVSKSPPPSKNWKWLSPEVSPDSRLSSESQGFSELFEYINAKPIRTWDNIDNNSIALAGGIWTNDAMGDWWFDRGISPSKQARFTAYLHWLKNEKLPPETPALASTGLPLKKWTVKTSQHEEPHEISFPEIPKSHDPVLIGRGTSIQTVTVEGENVILSLRSWNEQWNSPPVWTAKEQK